MSAKKPHMSGPLGNFCNDDNSFCIDLTHASANDGQLWGTLKEHAQRYPTTGSYYHRDDTYTDVWFITDNAESKDSWQGEIDSLRGYLTLSAIRAHAMPGGRHALTGYHLKERPLPHSAQRDRSNERAPLYSRLFLQLKHWILD